jgi:hypothetical protein
VSLAHHVRRTEEVREFARWSRWRLEHEQRRLVAWLENENQHLAVAIAEATKRHKQREKYFRRRLKQVRAQLGKSRIEKVRALLTSPNTGEAQAAREALGRLSKRPPRAAGSDGI